jgi:hypothetical protein
LDAHVESQRVVLARLEADAAAFEARRVLIGETRAEFFERAQAEVIYFDDPMLSQAANSMARVTLTRERDEHLTRAEAAEKLRKLQAASRKLSDKHGPFTFAARDEAIAAVLSDGNLGLPAGDSADRAGKKWYTRRSWWEPAEGAFNGEGGPAWVWDAQKQHEDGNAVEQHEERLERRDNHVRSERTQTTSVCDVVLPVLFDPGAPVTLDAFRLMAARSGVLCASVIDSNLNNKNMESVNTCLNLVEGILRMKCNMSLGNLTDRGIPQEVRLFGAISMFGGWFSSLVACLVVFACLQVL